MRVGIARWFRMTPLFGWRALACGIAAVGLPTIVRASVAGTVTGCEFTPYLPFVLIAALSLRWWQAGVVALSSGLILGGIWEASPSFAMACFIQASAIFVGSSAIIIGVAAAIRRFLQTTQQLDADESQGGIIFSLEKGDVWASWYGKGLPVRLGSQRRVSAMMQDFLAQEKLGMRLTRRP